MTATFQIRRAVPALFAVVALAACAGGTSSADEVASLEDDTASTGSSDGTGSSGTAPASESSAGEDAPATTVDQEEALLAFAACMREHGVDMEDPTIGEDGEVQIQIGGETPEPGQARTDANLQAAMDECQDLMPQMSAADRSDFDPTEMQDQMLEFTQCMRANGVDIDDPDFSADGGLGGPETAEGGGDDGESGDGPRLAGPFGELDLSDPETQAAFDTCSEEVGLFGDGGVQVNVGGSPQGDDGDDGADSGAGGGE